jgi:hypothetical protein
MYALKKRSLMETGLFEYRLLTKDLGLVGTDFVLVQTTSDDVFGSWFKCGIYSPKEVSFEYVLDSVPEDIQVQLLFHLDLLT